ncbi:MAG TPA: SDR family NAD(P)-dependent oxidoreductase [Myxococcota bacterium]|nr:SDR family NAD(P)-dependent oxidoreductase [Myxococcota bacterium]
MAELRFDGRVAIVTGGGRGLGRAYAKLLAARGASVVVNDNGAALDGSGGSEEPAKSVVEEILAAGGIAAPDTRSVATPENGEAIVTGALDAFGRVDIVVNNAGILRDKAFHNMTSEMWDAVHGVHLRGAFHVTRPAYQRMRAQGFGRIVMTSSPSGTYGNFGQANYSAAKMGLVGLARTISIEGAKYDVKANVVSPNAATRMTEGLTGELGPHMAPEKVAPVVAYLCHESCALAGEILTAGAGRVARVFVGESAGLFNPSVSVEDVADYCARLADDAAFTTPRGVPDASALIAKALGL